MGEFLDFFKIKKNLANLLLLGILVLAIPLGVNLVRQQQILKSRAAADPIVFSGPNVKTIGSKVVATKPDVTLEITAPGDTGSGGGGGGGGSCSTNDACTVCILNNRPDILPFYQKNGWDIGCSNQPAVVQNWCGSVDTASCTSLKDGTCKASCQ